MKRIITISFFLFIGLTGFSQTRFSMATDASLLRSFKKEQQYWSIGQTVAAHFHLTKENGIYVWLSYFSPGRFSNDLTAVAKSGATNPQQVYYKNKAAMSFRHLSLGWKHYLQGSFDAEEKWNLYTLAGLGLMMGKIENTHTVAIDTASYAVPVLAGKANFKRLTLDLGVGYERQLGGDVYVYGEARALIPTTDYPSPYIFINKDAPFTASLNIGFRVLF